MANQKAGLAKDMGLPPYMEARPMKRGGFTYRVLMPNGRKVALGWNLDEALETYGKLRPELTESDVINQAAAELLARHKKGSKQRKIEFLLTLPDVRQLIEKSNGKCNITKKPFSNDKPAGSRIRPWAMSIDRKDATKGYTTENCRLVCAYVNVAMNQFGDALFVELIESIVRRVVREELLKKMTSNSI